MPITEVGGPTTTGGVSYQAWVAALWLARLLGSWNASPDAVVEVRVEGRSEVDDVEVAFASGRQWHVQAKRRLEEGTKAWKHFWKAAANFTRQADAEALLTVREGDARWDVLDTALERARESKDAADFRAGCKAAVAEVVRGITVALGSDDDDELRRVLGRTRLVRLSDERIQREIVDALPEVNVTPVQLATMLAEFAAAGGEVRRVFTTSSLRNRLATRGVDIAPSGATVAAYLSALQLSLGTVGLDGYASTSAETGFLWPRLSHANGEERADPFAEHLENNEVLAEDARTLLATEGRRTLLVAGAGFGKTALVEALARHAIAEGRIPVIVRLPVYAASAEAQLPSLLDWIGSDLQRRWGVTGPWETLAVRGELAMLFDGLDEVSRGMRPTVVARIREFTSRFVRVPWVTACRDRAAVAVGLAEAERSLGRLDEKALSQMLSAYASEEVASKVQRELIPRPELARLVEVPLFCVMLAGHVRKHGVEQLPTGPGGLLDAYVEHLLTPSATREAVELAHDAEALRTAASRLAYMAVEQDRQIWTPSEVRLAFGPDAGGATILDDLVRSGLLRQEGNEVRFVLPTVQEFLAGTYLGLERPDFVARAVIDQASRPWAQVAQFALTQMRDAETAVTAVLDDPDDLFHTNLLVVGRAIAWGARVSRTLRRRVGEELGTLVQEWETPTYSEVEDLLAVAFLDPVPIAVQEALRDHGLFGGLSMQRLAARVSDDVLLAAVVQTVEHGYGFWLLDDSLPRRIVALGLPALDVLEPAARTMEARWGLPKLFEAFASDPVCGPELARRHAARPLPPHVGYPIRWGCGSEEGLLEDFISACQELGKHCQVLLPYLWRLPDPNEAWKRLFSSPDTPDEVKDLLVWDAVEEHEATVSPALAELETSAAHLESRARLLGARACLLHDANAFEELCRISSPDEPRVLRILATALGVHEAPCGIEVLRRLSEANWTLAVRRDFVSSLVFPMTHETEPMGFSGSGMGVRTRQHPGIEHARQIAAPLLRTSSTPQQEIRDRTIAAGLGVPGADGTLEPLVRQLWQDDFANNDLSLTIAEAVRLAAFDATSEALWSSILRSCPDWNVSHAAFARLVILREPTANDLLTWRAERISDAGDDGLLQHQLQRAAIREKLRVHERDGILVAEPWDVQERIGTMNGS